MTTNPVSVEAVVKSVTVACAQEQAFRYFTHDFGRWWPVNTQSVVAYTSEFKDKPDSVTLEPYAGGRIFELTRSAEEHVWGKLLVWEPTTSVAFTFHPGRDEKEAQRVDVSFATVAEGTRVVLTHSGWENLSTNAQQSRDNYDQGWETVFGTTYSEYVRDAAQSEAQ